MKETLWVINVLMFRAPIWALGYIIGRAIRDLRKGFNNGKGSYW